MNAPSAAHDKRPKFTHGSLMRHVAVMTATGAIGLMAVFVVDLLSLFWVSKLGDQAFKAAVGYAGLMTFFVMSINIGLTIAASAMVSRALGAGDRPRARRLAASSLIITAVFSTVMAAAMFLLRDWILVKVLHAHGELAEVASKFIAISIPANVPLAVGMTFSGILRAVGDARRAMYVTLSAGIATAFLDPLLIFGLGLGVYGAAWATVLSRLILLGVGWLGAVGVHDLVARPKLNAARGDFGPIMAIGFPAIMANMAAPVSSAYTLRIFSDFGEPAIAASAVIDRVTPVAFGVVFALTASVGPIIGQNYGAKLMDRVQRTLTDSFILSIGYVLFAWAVLALAEPALIAAFEAKGESAQYIAFYCRLRRGRLDLPGVPVRGQRVVQQSRLSGAVDGVQLGAGDAGDDSVRDRRGALRRRAGRHVGLRAWSRIVRADRGRDGLCRDVAAREGDGRRRSRRVCGRRRKPPEEGRRRYGKALAMFVKLELRWVPAVPTAVTITSAINEAMSAYSIAVTPCWQSMNRRNSLVMAGVLEIPPHQARKFLTTDEIERRLFAVRGAPPAATVKAVPRAGAFLYLSRRPLHCRSGPTI